MSCRARTRRLTRGRTQSSATATAADATPEVICIDSPEPEQVKDAADADMDLDFAFDSELQALIDECAQPQPLSQSQLFSQSQPSLSRLSSQTERTQRRVAKTTKTASDTQRQRPLTERRRFRLASTPQSSQCSQPVHSTSDDDVWWRRYEPSSVDDLAVHSKKVQQVRSWLESATASPPAACFRVLVLEGPAGTCKSTCIRALAHSLSLHIVEWTNTQHADMAVSSQTDFEESNGLVRQFGDFLMRAERYSTLALRSASEATGSGRRIVLVDDLPNLAHPATREAFGRALQRFAHQPASSSCPLVLVVSDATSDDPLARDAVCSGADIMPRSLYDSAVVQAVRFNPVAPTIVARGLRRILLMHAQVEDTRAVRLTPACDARVRMISTACAGDMRVAVTMLQMAQMDGKEVCELGGRKRRRGQNVMEDEGQAEVVSGETRRVAVDLFHAAARVLHAKRRAPITSTPKGGPQSRGLLECDAADILSSVSADASTLQLFVHENHLDFCTSLEEASAASEYFSQADALSGGGRQMASRHASATAVADSYASLVALRGAMHVRGHPVFATEGVEVLQKVPRDRGITALRKPMFFEHARNLGANRRMCGEFVAAEREKGMRMWEGTDMLSVLPLWLHVALRRGCTGVLPETLRRLAHLAMVDAPDAVIAAATTASLTTTGDSGLGVEKLVLSDDDIADFSD